MSLFHTGQLNMMFPQVNESTGRLLFGLSDYDLHHNFKLHSGGCGKLNPVFQSVLYQPIEKIFYSLNWLPKLYGIRLLLAALPNGK